MEQSRRNGFDVRKSAGSYSGRPMLSTIPAPISAVAARPYAKQVFTSVAKTDFLVYISLEEPMKTIRDLMTTDVVWISPSAPAKSAVFLMKGHDIGALPVVHADDTVVGLVTHRGLLGQPQDARVMDVMEKEFTTVDPEMTVYDALEVMNRDRASYLLVLENERLAGIVSCSDLMPELGKTFDPLTELPWSDSFREWAINSLKRGMEISILFFDLDNFGAFNKRYGHVVGDAVLKETADVFKKGIDQNLDLACRYGGDEFVIVSVRSADETILLGDVIQKQISLIRIPEISEGVSASYGMSGGRRTREREDMHYAATIDDSDNPGEQELHCKQEASGGNAAAACC